MLTTSRYHPTVLASLLFLAVLLIVPIAVAENPVDDDHVFTVELDIYSNGTVSTERIGTTEGSPSASRSSVPEPTEHGQPLMAEWKDYHWLGVVDADGNVLSEHGVTLTFRDWSDAVDGDETVVERERVFERLAYHPDAERVHLVRGEGEVLHTLDLPTQICVDDGSCHFYCEDRGIDPDCDEAASLLPLVIFLILFISTGIIVYHVLERVSPSEHRENRKI